jgi:hypothetical protein
MDSIKQNVNKESGESLCQISLLLEGTRYPPHPNTKTSPQCNISCHLLEEQL